MNERCKCIGVWIVLVLFLSFDVWYKGMYIFGVFYLVCAENVFYYKKYNDGWWVIVLRWLISKGMINKL